MAEKKLMEDNFDRQTKIQDLAETQKIDGWGAKNWPSADGLCKTDMSSPLTSSVEASDKKDCVKKKKRKKTPEKPKEDENKIDKPSPCFDSECAEVPPGYFGFNGHQAIFHCYGPECEEYQPRKAKTDNCVIKLATTNTGEQVCTLVFEKTVVAPYFPQTVDKEITVSMDKKRSMELMLKAAKSENKSAGGGAKKEKGKGKKGGKGKGKGGKKGKKKK